MVGIQLGPYRGQDAMAQPKNVLSARSSEINEWLQNLDKTLIELESTQSELFTRLAPITAMHDKPCQQGPECAPEPTLCPVATALRVQCRRALILRDSLMAQISALAV